jgi:carbonic anhydrase/acetyltransferase-like protein (isoleucine patch superfamily)
MMFSLGDRSPQLKGAGHYIAPNAAVIGDVVLQANSSIWFSATLRADNTRITIGEGSNVQDGAVLHSDDGFPLVIEQNVTIGHNATVHGCTIESEVLIGIGATVLNGALIGKGSIVGANALVPEGMVVPPYSMVLGVPGKVVQSLPAEMSELLKAGAEHYRANAQRFTNDLKEVNNAN